MSAESANETPGGLRSPALPGSRLSATPETDWLRGKLESYGFKESYVAMLSHARKLEHERDAALKALEAIEERFVDGCDTYEDWRFMGETARAAMPPENAGSDARRDGSPNQQGG